MSCVFCGGKIEKQNVNFVYDDQNSFILIENVPAEVCAKCGEKTYSPEVTEELFQLSANKIKPKKIINVPVFDYAETSAVI